ncbi:hypothetical protein V6N12_029923 [Hibiscus sabdariffa]|uniref:Nodulin-like domain-containing protein n=1 Tax=Hibiscus sabdariffa TaxID=183260 RepID=A0ABR2CXJ4_9ROSI
MFHAVTVIDRLVVGSNSNGWFGTAVLVTNMRNFPLSRGTVSGILKGYSGISAAVFTVLYSFPLERSASKLLMFLTLGIPVICLAMMYFIRPCTPPSGEHSSVHVHFVFTQVASVLLSIYLITITVIYDTVPLNDTYSSKCRHTYTPGRFNREFDQGRNGPIPTHYDPLLSPSSSASNLGSFFESEYASDVETLLAVGEGAVKKKRRPRRGEDFKLHEAFIKADFWLLWFVYFLGVGSGVTVTNNLAQIGIAFGIDDTTILRMIQQYCSLFLASAISWVVSARVLFPNTLSAHLSKICSGHRLRTKFFQGDDNSIACTKSYPGSQGAVLSVSLRSCRTRSIPRTLWMACTLVAMVLAFVLYALAFSGTLYISTALLGVCYGFQYSLMVPTASELFGLKHFGIIYNFMLIGNPVGALLFSALLADSVYDVEAAKQGSSTCLRPECFQLTFFVLAGICGLGSILSLFLTIRI